MPCGNAGGIVHAVEDGVEAVGMVLLGGVGEVGVAGEQFADAKVAEISLVFGAGRGDDGSAGA